MRQAYFIHPFQKPWTQCLMNAIGGVHKVRSNLLKGRVSFVS